MGEALRSAGVTEDRRREVVNALEIGDTPVEEITSDRERIVALSTADAAARNFNASGPRRSSVPADRHRTSGVRGGRLHPAIFRAIEDTDPTDLGVESLAAPPMTVSARPR
jgi:CBS domain containing-hemolysin-like protein